MKTFDSSYRVGRCQACRTRPAYAWPAKSGLRLGDVRCPKCRRYLDRTSRMAHYMRELDAEEIAAMQAEAIEEYERLIVSAEDIVAQLKATAAEYRASLKRLARAAHRKAVA